MHSGSIATKASNIITMSSSNPKDFAKKKRVNRSAKLKQCKLDARREQWLSQVKKKGGKEEPNDVALINAGNGRGIVMEKLEISPRGEEESDGGPMHHYSDSESPSSSPMSHNGSVLEGNDSGTNFTGSSSSRSSSSSSSSRSGGSCSGSMSEEDEEGDDECLDDWETVADALAATEEKQKQDDHSLDTTSEIKNAVHVDSQPDDTTRSVSNIDIMKAKPENGVSLPIAPVNCHAWRPDDAFRPQSLPNLSKQYSFPSNSDRYFGCGGSVWGCKNVASAPTSCPICYEDLDFTDSSFFPCSCGFKLCLFCHKRILEEDARCPGCRKQYKNDPVKGEPTIDGGSLTYRLARSCSMITRS